MLQALHQPKALRQQAARPREHHHNGQDSSGSKGFRSHSQHGGRWESLVMTCHAVGSIKHTMAADHFCMSAEPYWPSHVACHNLTATVMAHLCISFHSNPSEATIIWWAALVGKGSALAQGQFTCC